MYEFQKRFTLEQRQEESLKIRKKYPDRIPIVAEVTQRVKRVNIKLKKNKFLVPKNNLSIGGFMSVLRKYVDGVSPNSALFLFINNELPPTSAFIAQLYEKNKDKDGFLYIEVSPESTFG